MRFIKFIIKVFRNYDYRDKIISVIAVLIFFLMLVKMMIFPYGFFGFGESNIYTEGLVSKNGIQNLNPLFIDYNEADREISRLIFSGLMKYDPEQEAIVDDMSNLLINEDKTVYTLTLREGLKWHDGKAVTTEDVYFTYHDVIMSSFFPNEILKANFEGVKIEKVSDKEIKFVLDKSNIFFITNLTTGIIPKHIFENIDPAEMLQSDINKMPIGSGPYLVTEAVTSFPDGRMQVTLERNPFYYGEIPKIEIFRFIVYPDMEKLISQSSIVNGVVKISGNYIAEFKKEDRFALIPYYLPQYTAIFLNMDSEILKDNQKVRLALQKAVDKESLMDKFIDKVPIDTPLMELNQEDWIYKANQEEAQGALKEAGFVYEESDAEKTGLRYDEDGNPLQLNFIARLYDEDSDQFEETKMVVSFLQESWESIGFDIRVELLALEDFKIRIMNRDYDLLLLGQSLGYNKDTYSYWHSNQASSSGQNLSNYKSFQVDTLIEDMRAVFNEEKRERELNELAEKIKEDIPAIFLYRPVYYYASDGKISGITMDGVVFPSDRFAKVAEWIFNK
ncbi:ABC transporter substrate-binding protein [Patescibacteria group bacterium]